MSILEATLHLVTTIVCPPWCVLPAGHDGGPGSIDHASGDQFIGHERRIAASIGSWDVDLARGDVQPPDGPAQVGDPIVLLNGDYLRPLSPAEARQLAAALATAADTADGHRPAVGRHAVDDSPTVIICAVPRSAA